MHHKITTREARTHARFSGTVNGRPSAFTLDKAMAEKVEKIIADGSAILAAEDIARLSMIGVDHAYKPIDVDGKPFFETKLPETQHVADTVLQFSGSSSETTPRTAVGPRKSGGVDHNLWKK